MGSGPLVSIITIFLDAERFLAEALESILAQTYDRWELLLIDDGSVDGSSAIARRHAAAHPDRVRYLEHPGHENRGMSASRSLGLRHARGEYVALLDSDDVWLPDKLERQVAEFDSYPTAGMIYGTTEYWYSWTRLPDDRQRDVVPPTGFTTDTLVAPPALLVRFLRGETRSPGTCSVLLRREVMEAVGGFEERFRGMYEDQAFFAKVCLAVPVLVTNACAARYRQHPDSCYARARQTGEAQLAEISYLRWLARHVAHDAGGSGEAWRTLQAILWPYRHPLLHRLRKRGRWAALRLGLGRWQGGRAEGR